MEGKGKSPHSENVNVTSSHVFIKLAIIIYCHLARQLAGGVLEHDRFKSVNSLTFVYYFTHIIPEAYNIYENSINW